MKTIGLFILFVFAILILNSCTASKALMGNQSKNTYSGTVYLKNGEQKTGIVTIPHYTDKQVSFSKEGGEAEMINSEKIDKIVLHNSETSIFRYMPIRSVFKKISRGWVLNIAEGPYVSAYIGAAFYEIDSDGKVYLVGRSLTINQGVNQAGATIPPSYPVYMMKQGDNALVQVAFRKGINYESSAFRTGVSRYLTDDPALTEYMRQEKWGFDDIGVIIENFNPNRGNKELTINGITVQPKKKRLITDAFDNELIFHVETAWPTDNNYGAQFGIGARSSFKRFFAYGGDLGYASAKYVDQSKRIDNHIDFRTAPVIEADFSKEGQFRFNTFAGFQLPLDFGKLYLIPSALYSFGATWGLEYGSTLHGPMVLLDFGIKLKQGTLLFIGGGYRRNTPIINKEDKASASYPGFEAYKPYGNLLFRIGCKL
ncbi:MAG: hypothetical protein FWF52_05935 [Candidatus Azobacteroides sp.]|nr:hypothetical protein [Candidatus Azobacteroides sp.]